MVGSPTLTSCMSILLKFLIAWTQHLPQVYFASCVIASILLTSAYYLFFPQIFFQESEDILLMDLSSEIDSNQNCVKGNPFTSSSVPRAPSSLSLENPFSSQCNFFPTPIHDPFSDDPFPKVMTNQSGTTLPQPAIAIITCLMVALRMVTLTT